MRLTNRRFDRSTGRQVDGLTGRWVNIIVVTMRVARTITLKLLSLMQISFDVSVTNGTKVLSCGYGANVDRR